MRYLLYLPAVILFLLPFLRMRYEAYSARDIQRQKDAEKAAAAEQRRIEAEQKQAEKAEQAARREAEKAEKAAEREAAKAAREAEQRRKQAERLDYARQLAEYAERALEAKREAREIERVPIILTPSEQTKQPAEPVAHEEPAAAVPPVPVFRAPEKPQQPVTGNNAFKGHVVAFTGKLPGMTRREAIQAVEANGGKAFTKMPVGTTLLVVGDNPGMCKMDKADEWIGQVRKITAAQFFDMLHEPLTMELDEFAAMFAA